MAPKINLYSWGEKEPLTTSILFISTCPNILFDEIVSLMTKKITASFDNVFLGNILLFSEKTLTLTNNSKHKTLKTIFTFMSYHNTLSTKKQTNPLKSFIGMNPTIFYFIYLQSLLTAESLSTFETNAFCVSHAC
jgi:hypothetical protein